MAALVRKVDDYRRRRSEQFLRLAPTHPAPLPLGRSHATNRRLRDQIKRIGEDAFEEHIMATPAATLAFSDSEQRRQLRRAIIASTVGTTIEWYDFFLYSTVTG